ncbi:hypothetical protein Scep_027007 [Stephania cephalantha]|uniref:Uncharacterized protein n=1 Tax=Stephania cephalantha TaxID=152367 RepID=A0AAP0ERU6_9MAGN
MGLSQNRLMIRKNSFEESIEVVSFNDTVGRLEELRIGNEELDLSEEQIRINNHLQEDEAFITMFLPFSHQSCGFQLLALEAIYGENVTRIHVQAPDEITVSTKLRNFNVDE